MQQLKHKNWSMKYCHMLSAGSSSKVCVCVCVCVFQKSTPVGSQSCPTGAINNYVRGWGRFIYRLGDWIFPLIADKWIMNEKNRALPRTSYSGHLALCVCVCVCVYTRGHSCCLCISRASQIQANLVFQLRSELFQETKTEDEDNSSRAVLTKQVFEMTRFALLYNRMYACVWVLCHAIIWGEM